MWADSLSRARKHTHEHTAPRVHKFSGFTRLDNIRDLKFADLWLQKSSVDILHLWRRRHLSANLRSLKSSAAMTVCEKLSVSLFVSCVVPHPSVAFYCFSLWLSFFLSPSFPVAASNKGLTGRAWRSWLLDGKGESHSWAGQASSLAKVMNSV